MWSLQQFTYIFGSAAYLGLMYGCYLYFKRNCPYYDRDTFQDDADKTEDSSDDEEPPFNALLDHRPAKPTGPILP